MLQKSQHKDTKKSKNNESDNIENNFLQEVEQLWSKYDKKRKALMDKFLSNDTTPQQFKMDMENLVNDKNEYYKKVSNLPHFSFLLDGIILCFFCSFGKKLPYCYIIFLLT